MSHRTALRPVDLRDAAGSRPPGTEQPGVGPGGTPMTRAEREARGRAARRSVPRRSHAEVGRREAGDDPVAWLEAQAATRVPELVPIRYGRMLASPFAFYRGAAAVMAADLARTPDSGLTVQLCGDAHIGNFGVFASPERHLVFDANDFDETAPGPFEWDVKRLAASLEIAGRDNGFPAKGRRSVIGQAVAEYRRGMGRFAEQSNLEVWYTRLDIDQTVAEMRARLKKAQVKRTEAEMARARARDSMQAFRKLTTTVDGVPQLVSDPPLIVRLADLVGGHDAGEVRGQLRRLLAAYSATLQHDRARLLAQYRLIDVARKVVGVGSVGTRSWVLLMQGIDGRDPLLLQAKEAQASVLEPFTGAGPWANHAQRVVDGQHLIQATSDIFLGWNSTADEDGAGIDYYIRQLRDWKGSGAPDEMDLRHMAAYGRMCAWTLARAHARSGDRVAIAAYLGSGTAFDRAVVEFADAYADRNEDDYAALRQAVATGRLTATTGI